MKLYIANMPDRKQSHSLLLKALSLYSGTDMWEIRTAPLGKPYAISAASAAPEIHFSLSHSGTFWAVCIDMHPSGLDLQQHKGPCSLALAKKYFHPEELAYWEQTGQEPAVFYAIWSAKESYVKYTGEGITGCFSQFSVFHPPVPLTSVPFIDGYSMYLCSDHLPTDLPIPEILPEYP